MISGWYSTALVAALIALGACAGQPETQMGETVMTSDAPEGSRPPPPEVSPVEYDGVRYEEDRVSGASGDRNGGYLAAYDVATGERLWRLQVYEVADHSGAGVPDLGLYFQSMRLLPGERALEVLNEAGGRYRVDLDARTSTQLQPSPPESQSSSPTKPKPEPD